MTKSPPIFSSLFSQPKLQALLIICLSFLVYANTLGHGFVWDDEIWLRWDQFRLFPTNFTTIISGPIPGDEITNYRPLKTLYYTLNYYFFADNPLPYHLQTILIHTANSLLVWLITWQLTKHRLASLISGLIFAVHPVHIEAVTWITAGLDSLGHVFFFTSLYAYLRSRQDSRRRWYRLSIITAILAFFTNELTFPLVILIWLHDYLLTKRHKPLWHRLYWPYWSGLFLYGFIRFGVLGITRSAAPIFDNLSDRFFFIFILLADYLKLLAWPFHLSLNHHLFDQITTLYHYERPLGVPYSGAPLLLTDPRIFLPLLGVSLSLILAYQLIRSRTLVSYCIFWFFISLLPVIQLTPTTTVFAERYLYLASFAFNLLIAILIVRLTSKSQPTTLIVFALPFIVLFGHRTYTRNRDWHSSYTIWRATYGQTPDSAMVAGNLGISLYNLGEYDQAQPYLIQAADSRPFDWRSKGTLAKLYLKRGKPQQALVEYLAIFELRPQDPNVLIAIADTYLLLDQPREAKPYYTKALGLDPTNTKVRDTLSTLPTD